MKKLAWGFALLVAVIGIVGYLNRDLIAMMLAFGRMKPEHSFAQDQQAAAPDYSGPDAWAALPDRADAAVIAGLLTNVMIFDGSGRPPFPASSWSSATGPGRSPKASPGSAATKRPR